MVMVESALEIALSKMRALKEYSMFDEVVHVQVARSYPIAEGIMLKPIDPVFIITGGCFTC